MKTEILYKIIYFIFLASLSVTFISCSEGGKSSQDRNELAVTRFYSAEDPGKWSTKVDEHDVDLKITTVMGRKVLDIQVPFARERQKRHYVEAILLLDANRKELQKKIFTSGYGEQGAKFDVTNNLNTPLTVVVKCNLHDMWEKEVDWSR